LDRFFILFGFDAIQEYVSLLLGHLSDELELPAVVLHDIREIGGERVSALEIGDFLLREHEVAFPMTAERDAMSAREITGELPVAEYHLGRSERQDRRSDIDDDGV